MSQSPQLGKLSRTAISPSELALCLEKDHLNTTFLFVFGLLNLIVNQIDYSIHTGLEEGLHVFTRWD
jgi:hypothetical protein